MMKLSITLTTSSNLLIGGTPRSFEIGGVDLHTAVDYAGRPIIPASSFKGALRSIVRDMATEEAAQEIIRGYKAYLDRIRPSGDILDKLPDDRQAKIEEIFAGGSVECLFGIEGVNDAPKLIFNDFVTVTQYDDDHIDLYFSLDSKNCLTVQYAPPDVAALPRRYRTVRPGIAFKGEILFYRMEKLEIEKCAAEFIQRAVLKFNDGLYRLGNSKSRGYGRIQAEVNIDGERGSDARKNDV